MWTPIAPDGCIGGGSGGSLGAELSEAARGSWLFEVDCGGLLLGGVSLSGMRSVAKKNMLVLLCTLSVFVTVYRCIFCFCV